MDDKVRNALQAVVKECPPSGYGEYAKAYAEAALNHPYQGSYMEGEELRVQIIYVLGNLHYWRGDRVREIKGILRAATK